MLKKVFIITVIFISLLLLCSCSSKRGENALDNIFNKERQLANERISDLLKSSENQDVNATKKLFSENIIEKIPGFENQVVNLFDYFEGAVVFWDDTEQPATSEKYRGDEQQLFLMSSFDVETTVTTYRIYIYDCAIDTLSPKNEGIWSLYIIKLEDDTDPDIVYRGDCKKTPGINIGIKNVLDW